MGAGPPEKRGALNPRSSNSVCLEAGDTSHSKDTANTRSTSSGEA
jgi:hypothetical protein